MATRETESEEAAGLKKQGLEGWHPRGQAQNPCQHWGTGKKIPTDQGWDFGHWWRFTDSNRGPVDYDSIALTD